MMQGDACYLGIAILNSAGSPVKPVDIQDVEITIGHLRKTWRSGQLSHDGGMWLFPISQGESFSLAPGAVRAQVRLAWANGVVEGQPLWGLEMEESLGKEAL